MSDPSSPSATPSPRAPSRWLGLAGALFLAASVLAIGSLPPAMSLVFGLGSSLLVGLWLLRRPGQGPPVGLAAAALAALALWSLLQCVPLPVAFLARLSPAGAGIWRQALVTSGAAAPSWAPITLAPGQTLMEATKWGAYAGLCLLGAWWARHRGLSQLCWAVVALALTVGAVTVAHGLLDAQTIFGIYEPIHSFPRWTRGPLLNINHLSAYLSLGFYAALALLLSERPPPFKSTVLLLVSAATLVVGVVALASRAAVVALALGGLLMPLVLLEGSQGKRLQQRRQLQQKTLVTLLGVFGVGVALALYGFGSGISKGLGDKNFSKLQTARDSLAMIRDYWLTGVGRGAFEGAFFRYKSPGDYEAWGRPENILVQWASEWGIPAALLAAGALLLALARAPGWRASRTARLLALGLAMLVLHNLLDFNLEVPAIAGLAAVLLGALTGLQGADLHRSPSPPRQRSFASLVAVGTAAAALLGWRAGPELPLLARSEAHALLKQNREREAPELGRFREWVKKYPADPYFPAAAGAALSRAQPAQALRWLGWALKQGPNLGVTRLVLAETLGRAGYRRQGLLEVRLAMERDPSSLNRAILLAKALVVTPEDILSCAPPEPHRYLFLEGVARTLPPQGELFRSVRQQILQQKPCIGFLQESLLREQLAAFEAQKAPCIGELGREACKSAIEEGLASMRLCPNLRELSARLRSDLLWALGERKTALQAMEESCEDAQDLTSCLQRVAQRSAELKDLERLRRTLRIVVSRLCQEPVACARAWSWAAGLHEQAGDLPSALVAITKGSEQDPNNMDVRFQHAQIALRMGANDRAELILRQLLARRPDHKQARAKLDELRGGSRAPQEPVRGEHR